MSVAGDTDAHRLRLAPGAARGGAALFLDRDGTVIEDPGFLSDPAGVRLLAGAAAALARFRDAGYRLVLVTNQSGIGRGYFSWDDYERVAEALRGKLAAHDLAFDAELVCGHRPEPKGACDWRKPGAGMLREAARRLGLDLPASVMVGDKLSDVEAGAAAGVGRLVLVGEHAEERAKLERSGLRAEYLGALADLQPCAS